jgi:hypothetical protein
MGKDMVSETDYLDLNVGSVVSSCVTLGNSTFLCFSASIFKNVNHDSPNM